MTPLEGGDKLNYLEIASKLVPVLGFLGGALGLFIKVCKEYRNIREGQRCQLRAEILRIYYHNKDRKCLRQYEAQNLVLLYKAYKALGGNSFIDELYEPMTQWEIET